MSDDKVLAMLGIERKDTVVVPEAKPERLDVSRCIVYPTRSQATAEGLFKRKYHVEATVSMATEIGGKRRIRAWLCGMIPKDWKELPDAPS